MKKVQELTLVAAKVPLCLREAMNHKEATQGINLSSQLRMALMQYLGVTDLTKPFVPANKEVAVTETA